MIQKLFSLLVVLTIVLSASVTNAQTVIASEDFDGGAVNLISGFDPALAQTSGDPLFRAFGEFNFSDFGYAPFSLADDSMFPTSGSVFEFDFEGIYGGAKTDNFFTCTSLTCFFEDPPTEEPCTATWTFDVSSATDTMTLNIDMGQLSNDSFDGVPGFADILFEYSIDGGPFQTAFDLLPTELVGSGFTYRLMDNGNSVDIDFFGDDIDENATAGTHSGLGAVNAGVVKTDAETGNVSPNTILNKSVPSTGDLDTFSIELSGSGNELVVRAIFDFNFEAFAMDNISITTPGDTKGIAGDVNCDGVVDLLDVSPFVTAVSNSTLDVKADVNGDGVDDLLDVAPFVALLTGG